MVRNSAFLLLGLLLGAIVVTAAPLPPAEHLTPRERAQGYREHIILAKPLAHLRDRVEAGEARERLRVRQRFNRFGDLRVIALDSADSADRAIARLRATGRYEFVERDYVRRAAVVPNDFAFATQQWSLNNTGQEGGVAGADIRAVAAWDIIRDASSVIVAVLDTGVNINHLDMVANTWRNPAPTFGDLNGAAFLNGVRSGDPLDYSGHGTHVAGIIGAVGNNGGGMTGVAWRVQIMPLRVISAEGFVATSDFAAGVDYALSHGAHIINASLFTDTHSHADLAIATAARAAGVIIVVAAGNEAANIDITPHYYPDHHPLDNIVSVGASTRAEALADYSNYGASVDLIAPGSNIASLFYGNNTGGVALSGTSMAAPHVAGALALLKARFPSDSYRQLINRLLRGVDVLPPYAGKAQTGGRLNLLRALTTNDNRPFNDDFSSRPRLEGAILALRSNNAGATAEPGEPAHAGLAPAGTLWWEWTAPASATVTLDTIGSGFDTTLAVYAGSSLAALTPVAASDDDEGRPTSRLSFSAQAGATYQIALGGKAGAAGAAFLKLGGSPANDAFSAAQLLTGQSTQVTARNILASREPGEPAILDAPGGASTWYRWTAPRSGRFQISTSTVDFDSVLAVYTGSALNALTLVAAGDNIGPGNENIDALCAIDAVAGTTYLIAVDARNGVTTGEFTLSITDALWQAATLRNLTGAPAIGLDGSVYVASTDFNVYAFAPDGTLRWRFPMAGAAENSTPAVAADGTIHVYSQDGKLYALRPNGTLRWLHDFGAVSTLIAGPTTGNSPAIAADGSLYVKAGDGRLYALDPANGATKWNYAVASRFFPASPVIGSDGTIYQGSTNGTLFALNPDGTLKWSYAAANTIAGAPAIDANGNLYFGTATSGQLVSLTAAGALRWTYTGASGDANSSPALSANGATVYFGAEDGKLHAVDTTTGAARWTFTLGGNVGKSSPAIDANGVVYIGSHDHKLYAINPDGTLKRTWDTGAKIDSSPILFGTTLYVGSDDAKLYAFDIGAYAGTGPWPQFRQNVRGLGRAVRDAPGVAAAPASRETAAGGTATFTIAAVGQGALSYQWSRNGTALSGQTTTSLTVANVQPASTGIYSVGITNPNGTTNQPVILGLNSTAKLLGAGTEFPNIFHGGTGFTYDQILLEAGAAAVKADAGQILRMSFIDLNDDIVQVEFSGAGTLSLVLDGVTGPALPVNYNQGTAYMKGHAGIVLTGADATTHLSVFSVGRANAVNQALFKDNVAYDGFADIAFIAITSTDGKFGGLRTANASYFATRGYTGLYAPNVEFQGPVFIGDIRAENDATPVIRIGSTADARITGGDLLQPNNRAVQISGLTQLQFSAGSNSHGTLFGAQANRARLEQDGVDVTSAVALNP